MRKSPITEAEIGRCLKALRDAGYDSGRVEITQKPDGAKVVAVIVGEASEPVAAPSNDFDTLIERIPKDAPTS